ncbi:MAG: ATP-dependent helicase [Candidatus Eisenbacteria bacterium]|nr:ATP-dependent helicase [Candidatus Eisenbacteria bacterium]
MTVQAGAGAQASPAGAAILEGLNDEQVQAVTHGEGPLLIVAGAGTGKTQVITRRIAWLIATKRARPEEILGLTFTDKAAAEMEARVDVLVPYGFVGATLSTFHAFCDRLVREHAVELGLTSQLRVETPAAILVFLRERLFELGLERYLPLGNPDEHLRALVALFDRARDEDVSPEQYREFAEGLAGEAGDDPERRDRARAELEKARAYATYTTLMMQHGRVDFGSQISLALRLLRERAYLRREIQERYRFVLVDEFQDTNHVQFELVRLLAGGRRNLTVVGDDDQSIYRFRGAKVENLMGFLDAFPGARVQVLRRNYRSGQRILDLAHRLIRENDPARLEATLGYDKRLVADRGIEGVVEHRAFASASDEAETVAVEIAEAITNGERRPGDFAVLARAHSSLDPFALALKNRGVRFRRVGLRGLYARPEVHLCLNVLRTLADPDDGAAAYMALGDPLFGADPVDLARLGAAATKRNRGLLRLAAEAAQGGALADRSREAIGRFHDLHRRLAESAVRRPTSEVLYEFVTESGLLGRLAAEDSAEAIERVQNLNRLFGIVARVGPLLRQDRVAQFIGHLDLLIEMGDDPAAAVVESDEEAVHLLTAHNAKGLEFPVVYLVHLVEGRFPRYRQGESLPLPPELRRGTHDEAADHYREERRLFYVGMTRARDRLVLAHAADYGGRRAHKPSRFVVEALALPAPPRGAKAATALESIQRYAPAVEAPAPGLAPVPAGQPLTISHGQIDDYLTCPLKYRYAHVAQVPLGSNPVVMYGIAIHHAIRVYHQHRMKGLPIAVEDVIAAFEGAWSSEGFYSREHEERRLEEGRETLRRFVAREEASRRVPLAIEKDFRFKLGDDLVVGRWDRIDEQPEGIVLADYKTSPLDDPEKADERAERSLKEEQLGLYALAYREMFGVVPARAELLYVGSGVTGSAAVTEEHLERAQRRAVEAAAGIRSAEFPPRPDQRNCGYCPYARFCIHSAAKGTGP